MIQCAECGNDMVLLQSRFGKFYGCTKYPACNGSHGAHDNGKPLGIPADKETKQARMKAHAIFDTIWKAGHLSRNRAYRWMQNVMGMTVKEAHIGRFTTEQCEKLIRKAIRFLNSKKG